VRLLQAPVHGGGREDCIAYLFRDPPRLLDKPHLGSIAYQYSSVEAHVLQLIQDLLLREEVPAGGHEVPEGARGVDGGAAGDEKRNGAAKKKKKKKA